MIAKTFFPYLKHGTLDLLFPPKCIKCGVLLRRSSLHTNRFSSFDVSQPSLLIESITSYYCINCLERFESDGGDNPEVNSDIDRKITSTEKGLRSSDDILQVTPGVRRIYATAPFEGLIKESIHILKYNGKIALAMPLGRLLFSTFLQEYGDPESDRMRGNDIDWIIPIPLYRWRMVKRGFNQAFLLVGEFKKLWVGTMGTVPQWNIDYRMLVRKKNTRTQTGFTREARQKNMKGAFSVKYGGQRRVKGSRILLVDDVHTTGATTAEAAKVLTAAGAVSVDVLVLAKA